MVDRERFAFASQLAVLRNCPDVLARLLRTGGSLLLAAKILVISRLLHKKGLQRTKPPPYLESIRVRLAGFRRKLLTKVDKVLQSLEVTGEMQVEAMCAFSLATSSSPTDVLRHFHHVRLDSMVTQVQGGTDIRQALSRALQIYVTTMKETKEYFPKQLSHALNMLKLTPTIKSQELYELIELNLDLHEQWIGDDVKIFVPYIRHDELQRSEAERILKQWAKQAFSSFLSALKIGLQPIVDPITVTQLRKDILQLWLSTPQQNIAIDFYEALEGLRDVFSSQSIQLIRSQIASLSDVGAVIDSTLLNWGSGGVDQCPSLWDSSTISNETTSGRNTFTELLARSKGETELLQRVSRSYKVWHERVNQIEEMIKRMRETRWDDVVNDIENDDLLEDKQAVLSEDDPRLLQKELQASLEVSFAQFETSMRTQVAKHDDLQHSQKSVFLLRVWREIRQQLPSNYRNLDIGIEAISNLQLIVAQLAIKAPLRACKRRIFTSTQNGHNLWRPLWEGDPKLPIIPSSWVFRLIHDIVSSMKRIGSDIWSVKAVNIVKNQLRVDLVSYLRDPKRSISSTSQVKETLVDGSDESRSDLESDSNTTNKRITNGERHTLDASHDDGNIQRLFDLFYLIHATTQKGEHIDQEVDDLVQLRDVIEKELHLEEGSQRRMRRDAEDYWRRTSMLFALMA